MEPNNDHVGQLYRLIERLKIVFPELAEYKIELKYDALPENVYGQIGYSIKGGKLDYLESLKKAKLIFKNYILDKIEITFNEKIVNLRGGVRKDILFFIASHELTHFLELPKQLTSTELGIHFDAHSEEFYKTHLERYNKFKLSRNEGQIDDIKKFEQIVHLTLNEVVREDAKTGGQVIPKDWSENGKEKD